MKKTIGYIGIAAIILFAVYALPAESVASLVVATLMFALYFLPTICAARRDHPSKNAIFLVNLVFGWTVLGWFFSLVWSQTAARQKVIIVQR